MTDRFTQDDFDFLLNTSTDNCLSLFMPTEKAGREVRQNSIRFKNLLAEAEALLSKKEKTSGFSEKILDPLRKLIPDNVFWANQNSGLAVFRLPESLRTYRLPMECRELVALNDHFHVKPLIPFLGKVRRFYILALSKNEARLLQCSFQQVKELVPENMPRSLADALKFDDPQRQLQFHTGTQAKGGGRRAAMFHGHGVGIDESKDNLMRYFHQVGKSLEPVLREEKAPLVLAAVDYAAAYYREANTYRHLLEEFIEGNPEGLSPEELQEQAWPFIETLIKEEEERALTAFEEKAGTGFTSTLIKDVVLSACQGRVDTLFAAQDLEQWGIVDQNRDEVIPYESRLPESYDLLNFAAIQTLLQGGAVFVLPQDRVPGKSIAAVYRY
jgi:hypothetical protein